MCIGKKTKNQINPSSSSRWRQFDCTHIYFGIFGERAHITIARARESDRQAAGSRGRATPRNRTLTSRPTISFVMQFYALAQAQSERRWNLNSLAASLVQLSRFRLLCWLDYSIFFIYFLQRGAQKHNRGEASERERTTKRARISRPRRDRAVL